MCNPTYCNTHIIHTLHSSTHTPNPSREHNTRFPAADVPLQRDSFPNIYEHIYNVSECVCVLKISEHINACNFLCLRLLTHTHIRAYIHRWTWLAQSSIGMWCMDFLLSSTKLVSRRRRYRECVYVCWSVTYLCVCVVSLYHFSSLIYTHTHTHHTHTHTRIHTHTLTQNDPFTQLPDIASPWIPEVKSHVLDLCTGVKCARTCLYLYARVTHIRIPALYYTIPFAIAKHMEAYAQKLCRIIRCYRSSRCMAVQIHDVLLHQPMVRVV
jgi:hypothetical protein